MRFAKSTVLVSGIDGVYCVVLPKVSKPFVSKKFVSDLALNRIDFEKSVTR